MARYDEDEMSSGDDWRALDGERPGPSRSDDWQRLDTSAEEDEAKQPWSRRTKFTILGLALVVVVAFGAWAIQWLKPPSPACILLVGARYDTNLLLPPNVLGWKGLAGIDQWSRQGFAEHKWLFLKAHSGMRPVGNHELRGKNDWTKLREYLREASFKEDATIVVILSLFGAADAAADPVLFLDDPEGKATVKVQEVIGALTELQQNALQGGKHKNKNIVLVLDTVLVENHWPLGIFDNAFVAGLRKLEKDLPSDMYVVCSCAEGQRSWVSEEWQRSMFAHYVLLGLAGAADADLNHKVTLDELFEFVENKVHDWVLGNRDTEQKPIFLGNRQAARHVDLVQVDQAVAEDTADKAPGHEFKGLSPDLKDAWKEWQALKATASWTYAPQVWRQYQDALLRWEYLERTGCTEHVEELKRLAKQNVDAVKKAAAVKFTAGCLSNNIPIAASLGQAPNSPVPPEAEQLWHVWKEHWNEERRAAQLKTAKERADALEEVEKKWQEAERAWNAAAKGSAAIPAAEYARLASLPLDELINDAKENRAARDDFDRAAGFFRKILPDDQIWPIEAHFLVMLQKNTLPTAPAPLLCDAVRVRRLAECVMLGVDRERMPSAATPSYCEFIFPLVTSRLENADALRRHGYEDLLFGSTTTDWDEAAQLLKKAEEQFDAIKSQTGKLRAALAARDRGWAELPLLAQWLSRWPYEGKNNPKKADSFGKQELKMLDAGLAKLTDLTKVLEKLGDPTDTQIKDVADLAYEVNQACKELLAAYETQNTAIQKVQSSTNQLLYHQIEAALSVPLIDDTKQRNELLAKGRVNSDNLNNASMARKEIGREIYFAESGTLKTLARHAFGPTVDDPKKGGLATILEKLPQQIQSGLDRSIEKTELSGAKELLREPDRLCRLIPGGRVARGENKATAFSAPEGWRRLHVHDLLLFLAARTKMDYWYKEDGTTPYYADPALAYADAAAKLAEGKKEAALIAERTKLASKLVEQIREPVVLKLEPMTRNPAAWTTEYTFPVAWKIVAGANLPQGVPMSWESLIDNREPAKGDAEPPAKRTRRPQPSAQGQLEVPYELFAKDRPELNEAKLVRLALLYRGQRLSADIEVKRHEPNLIVQRRDPPRTAHVAVRMAKDLKYGALSIVLDTSGSMAWKYPTEFEFDKKTQKKEPVAGTEQKDRRLDYAVRALDEVLSQMPELEHLSIVHFDELDNSKPKIMRNEPWDPVQLEKLKGKLFHLGLNSNSPIARAVELSIEKGFPKFYDGPKVVPVLTDGADNLSFGKVGKDPKTDYTYPKLVQGLLFDELRTKYPGISVMTVCFIKKDKSDPEYVAATQQFQEESPRGDRIFLTVEDGKDLGPKIRELLRPRLLLTAQNTGKDQDDTHQLDINRWDGNLDWSRVNVADYRSGVVGQLVDYGSLSFGRSQNMLLTLKRSDERFFLERSLVAREEKAKKRLDPYHLIKNDKNWFATLYASDRFEGRGLNQLLFLEKTASSARTITLPRPEMVWLDAASTDGSPVNGVVRWQDDWDGAAPAYHLLAKPWPEKRGPKLSAYWQEDFPEKASYCTRWSPRNQSDKELQLPVGETWFKIESIGDEFEKAMPDQKEACRCLVLRVAHKIGSPVWIRLASWGESTIHTGGWRGGHEHQYFSDVGKYTVKFYRWSDTGHADAKFDVLCVNSFKKVDRMHAEFTPTVDHPIRSDEYHGRKVDAAPSP